MRDSKLFKIQRPKLQSIKEKIRQLVQKRPPKTVIIAFLIIGLSLLLAYQKSLFVAASVNGIPITTWEVLTRLNSQYRNQVIDQLINEKLILTEAANKGVVVSDQEITDKIAQIEAKVGGASMLNSLLYQQSQTRQNLARQLKFQLIIEKMFAKEATVSAEEISQFIATNKDFMQATESAAQEQEARETLSQQKLGQLFNQAFAEIKNQAKIQIF